MTAILEPGCVSPYHAASSAPVRVLPQPRPARISQVDQLPGGVSWAGRALFFQFSLAAIAARLGLSRAVQSFDKFSECSIAFNLVVQFSG